MCDYCNSLYLHVSMPSPNIAPAAYYFPIIVSALSNKCLMFVFRTFFLSYVYFCSLSFRHIECISGVFKIYFSTFGDHSLSSILDGVFSYHYSGYRPFHGQSYAIPEGISKTPAGIGSATTILTIVLSFNFSGSLFLILSSIVSFFCSCQQGMDIH